jgi:tight adherence protein C
VLVLIIGVAALAAAAFLIGEAATAPARQRGLSVRRATTYGRFRLPGRDDRRPFSERVLAPTKLALARGVLRLTPRTTFDSVTAKLLAAGLGRRLSPTGFLAAKAAFGIAGFVLGGLYGGVLGPLGTVFLALTFGAGGFILPDYVISTRARRRKEQIRAELPDALDLLMVSVEAGLGFDGAVARLTEHMEGPLAEEFALMLGEMRIGESRQDALKRLAERVPAAEVAAFSRSIIQSDQLGMSLGRILRVQAADSRLRRQAAAEEKAMKAPIKMLFPTVIFIFPAMFIVVLGPAFLNLAKLF